MKKIVTIIAALFITASVFAQTPEKMSYQAILRDASNKLLTTQSVGMQISILQGSVTGSSVYVESQTPTTNTNGLVSLEIGNGTVMSGTFSDIDWANGPYFIKTETDPTGGTSYTISGTSQLMSIPYALHAKTASSIVGGITETDPLFGASLANGITDTDTANWNKKLNSFTETDPLYLASISKGITAADTANWNNHTIDTDTHLDSTGVAALGYVAGIQTISRSGVNVTLSKGGGTYTDSVNIYTAGTNIKISGNVISSIPQFYLGKDTLGGFVYYIYLDSAGIQHGLIVSKKVSTGTWQTSPYRTVTGATSTWDGKGNTALMTNSPVKTFVNNLGSGWYIPANDELVLLWQNRFHVNKALFNANLTKIGREDLWSSTELDNYYAYSLNFAPGVMEWGYSKYQTLSVRGVRAF